MRRATARIVVVACAGLWLAGCSTSSDLSSLFGSKPQEKPVPIASNEAPPADGMTTGSVPPPLGAPAASTQGLLGSDPNDDLSLGKK
ncbi:MAG: hypothetical protein ACREFC_10595, partial [Stellaceae bacterium]